MKWKIFLVTLQNVNKPCTRYSIRCNSILIHLAKKICVEDLRTSVNGRVTGLLNLRIKNKAECCNSDQICFLIFQNKIVVGSSLFRNPSGNFTDVG